MANPYRLAEARFAAKVEAAPGTTETLAAGDIFLGENLQFNVKYGNTDNSGQTGVLSREPGAVGTQSVEYSCRVALKGQGSAGTAPEWRDIIMSCGMSETVSGGVSVTYAPAAPESYYTVGYECPGLGGAGEDLIYRAAGCQSNMKLVWKGGDLMWADFNGMGALATAPADGTLLAAPTWDTTAPQAFLTPVLTLQGIGSLPFETLEVDLGNTLSMRPNANGSTGFLTAQITGRKVVGSIDVEAMKLATFNPYQRAVAGTTGAIAMTAIGAAGNKVAISMPKIRITGVDHGARAGALVTKLSFEALRSANAGNDELSIILT